MADAMTMTTTPPNVRCREGRGTLGLSRLFRMILPAAVVLPLSGCIERTIRITSEPPGALVYVNDLEVGRTPTEFEFEYYGTYDVRLVSEGFETWTGPKYTPVPLYDYPVIDLFAELAPVRFTTEIDWHFDLDPVETDPDALLDRASQLRARFDAPDAPPERAAGDDAGIDPDTNADPWAP